MFISSPPPIPIEHARPYLADGRWVRFGVTPKWAWIAWPPSAQVGIEVSKLRRNIQEVAARFEFEQWE